MPENIKKKKSGKLSNKEPRKYKVLNTALLSSMAGLTVFGAAATPAITATNKKRQDEEIERLKSIIEGMMSPEDLAKAEQPKTPGIMGPDGKPMTMQQVMDMINKMYGNQNGNGQTTPNGQTPQGGDQNVELDFNEILKQLMEQLGQEDTSPNAPVDPQIITDLMDELNDIQARQQQHQVTNPNDKAMPQQTSHINQALNAVTDSNPTAGTTERAIYDSVPGYLSLPSSTSNAFDQTYTVATMKQLLQSNSVSTDTVNKLTKVDKVYASEDDRNAVYLLEFTFGTTKITKKVVVGYPKSKNEIILESLTESNIIYKNTAALAGSVPMFVDESDFSVSTPGVEITNVTFSPTTSISDTRIDYIVEVRKGTATATIHKFVTYANSLAPTYMQQIPDTLKVFAKVDALHPLDSTTILSRINPAVAPFVNVGTMTPVAMEAQDHFRVDDQRYDVVDSDVTRLESMLVGTFIVRMGHYIAQNGEIDVTFTQDATDRYLGANNHLDDKFKLIQILVRNLYDNGFNTDETNILVKIDAFKAMIAGRDAQIVKDMIDQVLYDVTCGGDLGHTPTRAEIEAALASQQEIPFVTPYSINGRNDLSISGNVIYELLSVETKESTEMGLLGFFDSVSQEYLDKINQVVPYEVDLEAGGIHKTINFLVLNQDQSTRHGIEAFNEGNVKVDDSLISMAGPDGITVDNPATPTDESADNVKSTTGVLAGFPPRTIDKDMFSLADGLPPLPAGIDPNDYEIMDVEYQVTPMFDDNSAVVKVLIADKNRFNAV